MWARLEAPVALRLIFRPRSGNAGKNADAEENQARDRDVLRRHVRGHKCPGNSANKECSTDEIDRKGHERAPGETGQSDQKWLTFRSATLDLQT